MEWTPRFADPENESLNYYLLHGIPECPLGESAVIPNRKSADQEYTIYPNGSAHIAGETYLSSPFSFCGDNIISKEVERTYDYIIRYFRIIFHCIIGK